MDLLKEIMNCTTTAEIDALIKAKISEKQEKSTRVTQLGFLDNGKSNNIFKGFIPLDTKIKYSNLAIETYSMQTTDFFYEFAHFIRKFNINNKGGLILNLEYFINNYFGFPGKVSREAIFNDRAWNNSTTDEEYFAALENNKIGDLKGMGAAECTERSALANQILSLFDIDVYYCFGCIAQGDKEESHAFNIVKRQNDYALVDYSMPVTAFTLDGKVKGFYPFVGALTNEEFLKFCNGGVIREMVNYEYVDGKKQLLDSTRKYIVGSFSLIQENSKKI